MTFFHFKEIPPASFPTKDEALPLCPAGERQPKSLDRTHLPPRDSGGSLPDPGPFVRDGHRRQTVAGGLRDPERVALSACSCWE